MIVGCCVWIEWKVLALASNNESLLLVFALGPYDDDDDDVVSSHRGGPFLLSPVVVVVVVLQAPSFPHFQVS
jgi:hypothetical protein